MLSIATRAARSSGVRHFAKKAAPKKVRYTVAVLACAITDTVPATRTSNRCQSHTPPFAPPVPGRRPRRRPSRLQGCRPRSRPPPEAFRHPRPLRQRHLLRRLGRGVARPRGERAARDTEGERGGEGGGRQLNYTPDWTPLRRRENQHVAQGCKAPVSRARGGRGTR